MLNQLVGKGYFAFDCVGLIKGLLWGWKGESSLVYGGAKYADGSPDNKANQMIEMCKDVHLLFDDISPSEVVWMQGHIDIYIGVGKVVEATLPWNNGVQITSLDNIRHIPGMVGRIWTKHGKLP